MEILSFHGTEIAVLKTKEPFFGPESKCHSAAKNWTVVPFLSIVKVFSFINPLQNSSWPILVLCTAFRITIVPRNTEELNHLDDHEQTYFV